MNHRTSTIINRITSLIITCPGVSVIPKIPKQPHSFWSIPETITKAIRAIKTDNWKENLINNIMSTFFGSGGSKGFMSTNKKYVDSVPNYNSIYLTKIIQKERYSDNIGVGEDYEFNQRSKTKIGSENH